MMEFVRCKNCGNGGPLDIELEYERDKTHCDKCHAEDCDLVQWHFCNIDCLYTFIKKLKRHKCKFKPTGGSNHYYTEKEWHSMFKQYKEMYGKRTSRMEGCPICQKIRFCSYVIGKDGRLDLKTRRVKKSTKKC